MQRNKIGMVMAEFVGTLMLASLVLAQANAVGAILTSTWFVAATAGLTLAVLVLALGRVSGGHFNPAVTLGAWSVRKVETTTALVYIAAQMFGGLLALVLFQYFSNSTVANVGGGFDSRVFFAEMGGAFVFTHGIAAAVMQKLSGYKQAFLIGTSLMLGAIVASTASSGILNPAVALGLNSWSWTYALAPVVGSLLGFNVYALFFAPMEEMKLAESRKVASVVSGDAPKVTVTTKKVTTKKAKSKKRR
jgi:glycerol uptake facilitator-like aquaporin